MVKMGKWVEKLIGVARRTRYAPWSLSAMEVDVAHHHVPKVHDLSEEDVDSQDKRSQMVVGEEEEEKVERLHNLSSGGAGGALWEVQDGEGKRIPWSYRRRRVMESRIGEVGAKGEEYGGGGGSECEEWPQRNEEWLGGNEEWDRVEEVAWRQKRSGEGRRVTFSERRRRRFGARAEEAPEALGRGAVPQRGDKRVPVSSAEENVAEEEDEEAKEGRGSEESGATQKDDAWPLQAVLGDVAGALYERAPEETMRVRREKRRRAKEREAKEMRRAPFAPALARFEYPRGPHWPRNSVFGEDANIVDCENTALAMMAVLENRVTELIDRRALSEDVLQWMRAQVTILDGELRTRRDETVQSVETARGRAKHALQSLRLNMVALMTETTQFTFEALEDVRSALITQILADEEQVQWELEKMDAQVGEIAKPLALLHHLTSQLRSLDEATASALLSNNLPMDSATHHHQLQQHAQNVQTLQNLPQTAVHNAANPPQNITSLDMLQDHTAVAPQQAQQLPLAKASSLVPAAGSSSLPPPPHASSPSAMASLAAVATSGASAAPSGHLSPPHTSPAAPKYPASTSSSSSSSPALFPLSSL